VLDRDLPVVHGDKICEELAGGPSRLLMLTAATSVEDRVSGLRMGADDYLPKPFAFEELVARIEALARRPSHGLAPVLELGDLRIDTGKRSVARDGRLLNLTKKEYGVLQALAAARGQVVSSEALLEAVWDANADPFTNVVRVTVMTLRRKLGEPNPIETVAGVGYRLA
jgi:DNA-binding response OmpR family regulator